MAAKRLVSLLQAEETVKQCHAPTSATMSAQQSAATSPAGSIELVPASVSIPTDMNIGEPSRLSKALAPILERPVEVRSRESQTESPRQSVSKPSASSELLKIDELNIYMAACAEYSRGLAAGWTEERLLAMVTKWRIFDQENNQG